MTWTRLLGGVVVSALLLFGFFGGEYSTPDWWQVKGRVHDEEAAIDRLQGEIDSLTAWAEVVEADSATQERVAREKFGMIRDGEHLFRVEPVER